MAIPLAGHAREALMNPQEGDGAPRSAVRMVSAILFENRGGRLAARHMRIGSPEAGCACYLRRPYGVGPRFNPGLSVRDLTASSWRGLLVVPGEPRCRPSVSLRRDPRAPHPVPRF